MNILPFEEPSDIQYVLDKMELNHHLSHIPVDEYSLNILLYNIEESKQRGDDLKNYYENILILNSMLQKKNNNLENTYKLLFSNLKNNEFILSNLKNLIEIMMNIQYGIVDDNGVTTINFINPKKNTNTNTNFKFNQTINNPFKTENYEIVCKPALHQQQSQSFYSPTYNSINKIHNTLQKKLNIMDAMRLAYINGIE